MQVVKRTFAAKQHAIGSPERLRLNEDWRTSEYMPSHKFGILTDSGEKTPWTARTRADCETIIARNAG